MDRRGLSVAGIREADTGPAVDDQTVRTLLRQMFDAAAESAWPDVDVSGVVVTGYGHVVLAGRIGQRQRAAMGSAV